jgi:phospholipase/carboxylesterase
MGFSQGGVLAYELALSDPGRFAGVVALSSWLPADLADAIPAQPGSENFPAFVVHGTRDPMIPSGPGVRKAWIAASRDHREYEMGAQARALRGLVG